MGQRKKTFFFKNFFLRNYRTYENRTGVVGKGSSRPLRPYFSRPDRTNRSRFKGNKGRKHFSLTIFFSETEARTRTRPGSLVSSRSALYAHIFLVQIGPIGAEIFFSETIEPRRTGPGSLERDRHALYAHIFLVQIGPIGADTYDNRTGVVGKGLSRPLRSYFCVQIGPIGADTYENRTRVTGKCSSRPLRPYFFLQVGPIGAEIFFSETIEPTRTGPGSLERDRHALYAHIFLVQIEPIGAEKHFSLTIFFSETKARTRTRPGSLVSSRSALYAHIFLVQIGPIGADTYENPTGVIGKKHFSLTIFLSETKARTRTGPGSLERACRAHCAHIFCVQIGPIGADTYENRTRVTGKCSSRPLRPYFFLQVGPIGAEIFFSETIEPKRTGPGSSERDRHALYAHIFLVQIEPIGAEHVREPDRGNKGKKHFSLTIFFSETKARTRTGPGSLERACRAHCARIFCVQIGPIGADTYENRTRVTGKCSSRPLRPYFFLQVEPIGAEIFFSETIEPRRTGPGSLERDRHALYAHIFLVQIEPIGADTYENRTGVVGKGSSRPLRPYFFRPDRTNRSRVITNLGEPDRAPMRTGPRSLERARHALYAHIFLVQIGPIGADTYENRTGVVGKGLSRPLRPYFLRTDRTNRSRVITQVGEHDRGYWKGLVAPSTPIFFPPGRTNRSRFKWDRGKKHFSLRIFFSETIEPRRTGPGSLERDRHALYAHIFLVQIEPIGADTYENPTGVFGNKGKKHFSLTIFFSETKARTRTGPGSLERDRHALYAHIFLVQIGPIGADTYENRTRVTGKGSSRPLRPYFFLQEPSYNAPWRTGPGSLERARHALYANIFPVQIGPIGADTYENLTGVVGKGSSRPLRQYFFRPDRTNRSRFKGDRGKKHFSLRIFFSETIEPRRTGPGSLERDRHALYAHIFPVQIGPIGADTYENRTGVVGKGLSRPLRPYFLRTDRTNRSRFITENPTEAIGKGSSRPLRPYFFRTDRTNRSRVITHLEEPGRGHWKGLVTPSTPIFFPTYENLTGVVGKGSSRPLRQYFFRPDRTNRSRFKGDRGKKHFSLRIFFSETIEPRRTGPGSLERDRHALYAHIFPVQIGPIGADTYENPTGVIGNKGKKHFSLTIFLSGTIAGRRNPTEAIGKGSSRPLRPYFFRTDRTNRSRVITENPTGVVGKGSSGSLRPYFSRPDRTNRSRFKGNKGKKHFSLTIFFSETKARTRTRPGSLVSSRSALYAHIFLVQIGPIGADTYENRTGVVGKGLSRPLRPYFLRTDRTNRSRFITEPSNNAPRRTRPGSLERARQAVYAHIFFVQIGPIGADTYENQTGVVGKGSSRPLRAYFFCPDEINRSRVITENLTGVVGKGPSRPLRPYFSRTYQINRSRVITHLREADWENKGKKHFSLTIFFPETVAPSRTGPGSLERARRALYAHIFCVHIGPIGAEIFSSGTIAPRRTRLGSLERALHALYFKGNKGKKHFSLTIFFSETIARTRTGPGYLEMARRALHANIFFVEIGPIVAEEQRKKTFSFNNFFLRNCNTYEDRARVTGKGSSRPRRPYFLHTDRTNSSRVITNKGKKHFPLTIFFSETIAPRRTGPGSFERARRALYAHIFCVHIGPIGAEIFLSGTIAPRRTRLGSLERALHALYAHIFFVQIGHIGADTYENRTRVSGNGSSRPPRQYFFRPDQTNSSRVLTNKGKKHFSLTIFFPETVAPSRTGPGSLERARRAPYAHIFSSRSDTSEPSYNAPRITGPGSLERARHAVYAHIFFVQIGPIGAERTGPGSLERARHAVYAHIFFVQIGPIGAERTGPGSWERARRALYAHIFFVQIGPIGAEKHKGKKNFSLTIFPSETIAPRRTGPGSLERARSALDAHIFFVQIGPIGADTFENGTRVTGKGSSRPLRPYFLRTDRTNRSRFITNIGKKHFSLTIFFSETIAHTANGPESLESPRSALYAHIFFVQIGPIGADLSRTYENRTRVNGKGPSRPLRPYFLHTDRTNRSRHLGEPVRAPMRTGPRSLERARHALYAHIFLVQIGPIGADTYENLTGVVGKGSSRPLRQYFFRPDRTNRSRVITV
ncbi:hypothetical protein V1477_006266 [Vespula maculifrons]|uniref:Uncharacterized protein n=1 Tax=Vespula maculifrons TaxID=7453 RepID=A0ABD2CK73_VESMC